MNLNERMKQYETVSKTRLMKKTPVIVRIDGKAFHTFARGLNKPFDMILRDSLDDTMKYLCENIQGCVLGYAQSDEITLVLQDWKKNETAAWFDYEVQKMCSVSASMATMAFNKYFQKNVEEFCKEYEIEFDRLERLGKINKSFDNYMMTLIGCCESGAMFDSRCFNVPFSEVANVLIWRQQDATRNSIQSLAQSLFSGKEIEGISNKKLQDKMFSEKDVNWNDLQTKFKRGSCCIKEDCYIDVEMGDRFVAEIRDGLTKKSNWVIDNDIPIFTDDRTYIECRLPTVA